MASPSSPIIHASGHATTLHTVNMSSKLRRNSLVSDHDDIMLLREKLTRIAVGRRYDAEAKAEERDERRYQRSTGLALEPFRAFALLPPERPNTPPSSPQPRDMLRKQLKLKQPQVVTSRRQQTGRETQAEHEEGLKAMGCVDDVAIMSMEDVEGETAIPSLRPREHTRSAQARVSIPGHLRALSSSLSILHKHPEGWRKRKCVHVDAAEDGQEEPRGSLKKTSSQVNVLAASNGKWSRSSSARGGLLQTFAARRQRLEQDQEMEDVGCTTQPQSPENALFGNKRGQLSACS